jgi:predicted Zn finger-like uncharacterized protein
MKTQCPKCGYEGSIKDDLIPEGGRTVGCPQCKATFMVKKTGDEEKPAAHETSPPDVEVDGRDFIPFRERETRAARTRADRLVSRIAVLALSFAVVFIVGFLIGRYTHTYTLTNPLKIKEVVPSGLMTPASPDGEPAETMAPPVSPEAPAEAPDGETALPSEPLILEESFTSDVFLDISEIDGELNKATEVTGLQRELELKEYAQGLVGKMLVGYFVVTDVGKLGSSLAKTLPRSLYGYYIQADGDSSDSIQSIVYVGLKEVDEMSSSLDRGSRVFIQGFIYSCVLASDHFEMGIVNPKVEPNR